MGTQQDRRRIARRFDVLRERDSLGFKVPMACFVTPFVSYPREVADDRIPPALGCRIATLLRGLMPDACSANG